MRIVILILLFPSFLLSQQKNRVEVYFTAINEAEVHLMSENWNKAVISYEAAFEMTTDPFFTDVINFINCLILSDIPGINKSRKLTFWLNYTINEKRVHWDYLENLLFPHFLVKIYKNEHFYTKELKSNTLRADSTMLSIIHDDQNIRPSQGRRTEKEKVAIDSMDRVNFEKFIFFINQYGFPSERNLSYSLGQNNLWGSVSLLLRHFLQQGYGEKIIPVLQKEFENLLIPRNVLASIYDLEYNQCRGKKQNYYVVGSYIVFIGASIYKPLINYSDENIQLINNNRSRIYLPDLQTSINNAVCSTMCVDGKIKKFFIEPYVSFDNLPEFLFENEEDRNMLKSLKIEPIKFVSNCPCEKF